MSADKVQEARYAVDEARDGWFTSAEFDVRLDALIAAVREDEKQKCIAAVLRYAGTEANPETCAEAIRNA